MSESFYYEVNRPEVIAEKFDDEYVIVNLKSGAYYGLSGTGAIIWEMVVSGATQSEIATNLAEQFDTDPEAAARAVADLLIELEQETLIVPQSVPVLNAPNGNVPNPRPATRAPFVAPFLEKHVDMQEVLQLDPIHDVDEAGRPLNAYGNSGANELVQASILPSQFFAATGAAFEHALEECGGETTRYFCVAGAVVCLNFAGTALVEPLTRALGHLVTESVATPDLTICLWDVASTGIVIPPPPWSAETYGAKGEITGFGDNVILTAFQVDTRSLLLYHRERALAFYVKLDAALLPYYEASAPLRTIWHWWTHDSNCQLVHAGAVGTRAGGVLLVGKGGAGKSNTALTCLQSQLEYASDDNCIIQHDPTPIVHSLFSSAKTQRGDLARLPFLSPALSNPAGAETEKAVYFLHEHFPEKIIQSFPLRAILIPRVTGKRDTTIVPAIATDALLAVAPSTQAQLPYAGSQVVARIAQVVRRVPSYYLEVGTDIGQIPHAIQSVLEKYAAAEQTA